jgi:hypothetical protein
VSTTTVRKAFAPILVLTMACVTATAGVEIVELAKVQAAKGLMGTVHDPSGALLPNVRVDEVSPDWKTVLQTTSTDAQGRFAIVPASKQELYYLVFTLNAFNQLRVRVKVDHQSNHELSLQLDFST